MTDADVSIALYALTTGAVFTSVAFLEATINELFLGSRLSRRSFAALAKQLDTATARVLAQAWDEVVDLANTQPRATKKRPTLLKYQVALKLLGKPAFDETAPPYESNRRLIGLQTISFITTRSWLRRTHTSIRRK